MAVKSVNAHMHRYMMGDGACGETGGDITCVTPCTTMALLAVHVVAWKHMHWVARVRPVAFFDYIKEKNDKKKSRNKEKVVGLEIGGVIFEGWLPVAKIASSF